jgi:hypothetical protein
MPRRAIFELEQRAIESLPGAAGTVAPSFINEKKEELYIPNPISTIWNDSAETPNSVKFFNSCFFLR